MISKHNPYTTLGISRSATPDDIKRAYRRLAQRLHPDTNKKYGSVTQQFQDITAAYTLLTDDEKRARYDEQLDDPAYADDTYFTLRVTPSKRTVLPIGEEQVIYLLAEIFAAPQATDSNIDANLNLTLVLDQSNSMKGARIERVKVAAQRIIEEMSESDFLSVVTFNDRATVIIPSTQINDPAGLRARVTMIHASGGTEIFHGLSAGLAENRMNYNPRMVNHVILLTDGHTFGDQERTLQLAEAAAQEGIGISAMGLGHDWNDAFLDQIAALTGGASEYIRSSDDVVNFLNNHVRNLSNAFAERMFLSIAPDPDVELEMAFKITPNPQDMAVTDGRLPLASLQAKRPITVLMQFLLPANMPEGFRTVARLVAAGDILKNRIQSFQAVSDVSIEATERPSNQEPPAAILDALSKLTLYRLQERAQEALERGDIDEATRRLENLATRLLELGESALAHQTLTEAQHISQTRTLSEKGRKTLKYSTRALIGTQGLGDALSTLLAESMNRPESDEEAD